MGDQRPRIICSPPAPTSAGEEAAELAASFGLILDPWQRFFLDEALKEREDGTWASFEVGLTVSRQNGKGSCLEAIELAGLFLFGERVIIHSAHELKTAKEAMRRLETLLKQSGEKYKANRSHGEECLEILSGPNAGARVMFQTRTKAAGLGMTGDRVILDEAMHISSEAIQALMPTLSSRPNPQIIYTGSAVDQRIHPHCEVFGSVRDRALTAIREGKHPRLCYLEWSCPDDAVHSDPRSWAQSNPGLGYRQTEEKIADEYEAFKNNPRAFGVQRLGIGDWPSFGDARSEIPADRWQRMVNAEPYLTGPRSLVLYRAPDDGPWAIAGCQRTEDGLVHVEVGYAGEDDPDVVMQMFVDAVIAMDPAAVIVGRGAASAELTKLTNAGIDPIVPNLTEEAEASGGFLNDTFIKDGEIILSHRNQPGLNNAVSHAIKRNIPSGGFVWDMVEPAAYAQLMAVTLGRWSLLKYGSTKAKGPLIYSWPTDEEFEQWMASQ